MLNDTAINEVVEAHIAKQKDQNTTGDQNTDNNNSGGTGQSEEEKAAALLKQQDADKLTKQNEEADKAKEAEVLNKFLKELGVDSAEALKEKLSKKDEKVLTKEEKERADAVYEAKLQQYAVENGEMKLDDFHQLKTLKSKEDAALVFEDYIEDWKVDNPDETEDIEVKAKMDFDKEYKLDSKNEKSKAKGVARLSREAAEKRSPLESSYNKVKSNFDSVTETAQNLPKFKEGIEKMVTDAIPEKREFSKLKDGEEDVAIEVELTKEERDEIREKLVKKFDTLENYYQTFKAGKAEQVKEELNEYADYLVEKKLKEKGTAQIAEKFFERGKAKGSNIGAKQSFATNQGKAGVTEKTTKSKAEVEKEILEQFGKKT